jgi:hypothetical protein
MSAKNKPTNHVADLVADEHRSPIFMAENYKSSD